MPFSDTVIFLKKNNILVSLIVINLSLLMMVNTGAGYTASDSGIDTYSQGILAYQVEMTKVTILPNSIQIEFVFGANLQDYYANYKVEVYIKNLDNTVHHVIWSGSPSKSVTLDGEVIEDVVTASGSILTIAFSSTQFDEPESESDFLAKASIQYSSRGYFEDTVGTFVPPSFFITYWYIFVIAIAIIPIVFILRSCKMPWNHSKSRCSIR
jgi:hypothetical protein